MEKQSWSRDDPHSDLVPALGGEDIPEPAEGLPRWVEQVIKEVLVYTNRWRRPHCCDAEFWMEERKAVASFAAWQAYSELSEALDSEAVKYIFYKARSAVWTEYRRWIEWCRRKTDYDDFDDMVECICDPYPQREVEQILHHITIEEVINHHFSNSPRVRQVFNLWYFEEKTEREIALEMNISKSGVHKILSRVLDALRNSLSEK